MPNPRPTSRIGLIELEERATPAFLGGVRVAAGDVNGDGVTDVVAGAGPGGAQHVRVFNGRDGSELHSFYAGDSPVTAGLSVAAGEFTGDGVTDILTGSSDGTVAIWDGPTARPARVFAAFDERFSSAVSLASADVTGDGRDDIVVGAGTGSEPQVKVFDGRTGALVISFNAYAPSFSGGVSVTTADVTGDGRADVVVGAGPGGGPHVAVFDGRTGQVIHSFYAFATSFAGGVTLAAGDLTGDDRADVVVGAGPGGGPQVAAFDLANGALIMSSFAYDRHFTGGVAVGVADLNRDGTADVLTGAGAGGMPHVRGFDGRGRGPLASFLAFGPDVGGGIAVAPSDTTPPTLTLRPAGGTVNTNAALVGVAGDLESGVAALEVSTDGGPFAPVPFAPGGRFSFTPTLPLDGTADGPHVFGFRATDRAGNTSAVRSIGFTLDTRPPTAVAFPIGTHQSAPDSLTLTFGEPMEVVSAENVTLIRRPNATIPVTRVERVSATTLTIHFAAPLPNSEYELRVRGVRDLAGNPLAGPTTFAFTVAVPIGIAPVRVTAFTPADGESRVDPLREILVWFDAPVDATTVTEAGFFLFANGWKLPGAIRVTPNRHAVVFRPDAPLPPDTEVQVVVDGSRIRGANGLALDADGDGVAGGIAVSKFRTRADT